MVPSWRGTRCSGGSLHADDGTPPILGPGLSKAVNVRSTLVSSTPVKRAAIASRRRGVLLSCSL